MDLRLALPNDAGILNEIVFSVYGNTYGIKDLYNKESTANLLLGGLAGKVGGMSSIIAFQDDLPAGFGSILNKPGGEFELCRTMILKEFRNSGIGKQLVRERIDRIVSGNWNAISAELRAAEVSTQHNCISSGLEKIGGIFPAFGHDQIVNGRKEPVVELLIDAFKLSPLLNIRLKSLFVQNDDVEVLVGNFLNQLNESRHVLQSASFKYAGFEAIQLSGGFSVFIPSSEKTNSGEVLQFLDEKQSGASIGVVSASDSNSFFQKFFLDAGFVPCSIKPVFEGDSLLDLNIVFGKIHSDFARQVSFSREIECDLLLSRVKDELLAGKNELENWF